MGRPRKEATPPPSAGRLQKGVGRLPDEVRGKLAKFLAEKIDELPSMFEDLEPKQRADFLVKLLPYVTPKMSERAVTTSVNVTVGDQIRKLAGGSVELSDVPDAEPADEEVVDFSAPLLASLPDTGEGEAASAAPLP